MIIDRHGKIIFHSNSDREGSLIKELGNEETIISLNMQGRKVALKTGLIVYEFNYLLHLDEGGYLLKVALHKYANLINKRRQEEQWTAIGRMSALIAHEIRNALGSIKGVAESHREGSDTL